MINLSVVVVFCVFVVCSFFFVVVFMLLGEFGDFGEFLSGCKAMFSGDEGELKDSFEYVAFCCVLIVNEF